MTVELILAVGADNAVTATVSGAEKPLAGPTPLTDLPTIAVDDKQRESNPFIAAPFELGNRLFAAMGGKLLIDLLEQDAEYTLHLNVDQKAATIPWEFATTADQEFVVCNYAVLRILHEARAAPPARGDQLNFVAVAADPLVDEQGAPRTGYKLDIENELLAINAKLSQSQVALHAQRIPPTREDLQSALKQGPALLHLSCHGNVIESNRGPMAVLQLEDANGKADPLRGDQLVRLPPPGVLRLVLFSACRSAASALDADLARAMVLAGVPAAIGMQGNFPDALSDDLAATLYEFLLGGYGIGEAMRQARQALVTSPHAVGLPVAYVGPAGEPFETLASGRPTIQSMGQDRAVRLPPSLRPPETLLGREGALHQLAATFARHKVVTVVGTGGIGKTALSSAFAQRFAWRFQSDPNFPGVIGVSLADLPVVDAPNVLRALLTQLPGVTPQQLGEMGTDQMITSLLDALLPRGTLVLVDNYETVLQGLGEPELPTQPEGQQPAMEVLQRAIYQLAEKGVRLLLTSRRQPANLPGEVIFPPQSKALDGVAVAAGAALFFAHSSRATAHEETDQLLAATLAQATAGHPLAIALLAGEYDNSRELAAAEFATAWQVELGAARRPGLAAHHMTFDEVFSRSFDHLSLPQQQKLMALSRFGAPFFAEGARFLWGEQLEQLSTGGDDAPEKETETATVEADRQIRSELARFVQRSLLRVDGTFTDSDQAATYRFDPVIARSLTARLSASKLDSAARAKLDAGYSAYAGWLVNRAFGETGSDTGMARLVQQWLDELIAQASTQSKTAQAGYCWRLGYMARQFGRPQEGEELLKVGEIAARATEGTSTLGRILHERANLAVLWGDLDQALSLYNQSLDIQDQLGDIKGRSATLHQMANVFVTRGDLDQALSLYNQSLDIKDQLGDIKGRSATLHAMANVFVTRGDLDQALSLYNEALEIDDQLGDIQGRSATLHQMANVFVTRGDLDQALSLYNQSLDIKDQLGDIKGRSATLHQMANVFVTRGDLDQALSLYNQSLDIKDQLGDIKGRSATLHAMANVFVTRGDLDQALSLYNQSLDIKDQLGDIQGRSATLHEIAYVHVTRGDLDQALSLYNEALEIDDQLGDIQGRSATLHEIAYVHVTRGDLDQALSLYNQSLDIQDQLGDIKGRSATLSMMANVFVTRGDLDQALSLYNQSLDIQDQLGDIKGRSATLSMMANVRMAQQAWEEAERLIQEALHLSERLGDVGEVAFNRAKLGQVAAERNDRVTARQQYEEAIRLFERLGMPEANQVRQMLANLDSGAKGGRRRDGLPSRADTQVTAGDSTDTIAAQLAQLAPEERAKAEEAIRQFEALSPQEQEAYMLAMQKQQLVAHADQIDEAVQRAFAGGEIDGLLPQLDQAAAHFATNQAPDSASGQLAAYVQAVAALLRRQSVPPVAVAYTERLSRLKDALG